VSSLIELAGMPCLVVDADGPLVRDADGARGLIEEGMEQRARLIAVPVARLDASFFQLRSGLAGDVLQKMVNYGFKFAVLGDVSAYVAASDALRDFVVECNRGNSVFFVDDADALERRLSTLRSPADA
jgi:hypothetical protein